MNVRFFAGTKSQYLSLPVPRNPLGLYFCEDTKELFWADRLLTDGTRVVPTFKDLPSFEKAADGITYFVEETRNGYVLSSDRTDWVQVIYAPATESSVKAISFAGIELEEVDGVFTIDRRCAREALGFKVPEGMEDEEIVIATEDFVKNEIKKIDTPEVSLDGYATEQYVTEAIAAINPTVEEVKTKLDKEVLPIIPTVQETIIPTVQKVETEVIPVVKELAEKAATQEWVEEQGYLTEHQDLSEYAKKSEIPSVEGLASEEFVLKKIAEAELADQDVDLSAYYTKSETEAAIKSAVDAIDVPDVSNLATKEELEAVQNVAGSNSVKLMQLDSDLVDINAKLETIPSIEGLATETYVDEKFAAINIPDISNFITMEEVEAKGYINEVPAEYVTESELEDKGYLTEHQDISHLAEKDHVHAEYAAKEHEHDQYLTEHQDLSEYAKKSDIPEDETFVVDYNAPDFAVALEAYNNGKLLLLVNAAPDANGYAVMNYVRADMITFTKFLMSRSEAYGSFNTYYLHSNNTWEVSKEVKLNKVEANVSDEPVAELSTVRIGKEVYSIPSTEGLASIEYVDTAIAGIEIPESEKVDLTGYATEIYVDTKLAEVKVPTKVSELDNDAGYLVEHQDLSEYAKKTDIPAADGFATKQQVSTISSSVATHENRITSLEADYGKLVEEDIPTAVNSALEGKGYVTGTQVNSAISDSIDNFAETLPTMLTDYVTDAELNNKGYQTATQVNNAITEQLDNFGEALLTGYATETWVNSQNFAKKTDIPAVDSFATRDELNTAIEGIKHPTVDLSGYALKSEVAVKANEVPFESDKFVTHAIGDFVAGDNVIGLTVAQIFAKLLGLVDEPGENPDEPDVPDEPTTIPDKIITNNSVMCQVNELGTVVEIPYNYKEFTAEEYAAAPTQDCFYQLKDAEGNILESGYQHMSEENDSMYYVILLPKELDFATNVSVQSWDAVQNEWSYDNVSMSSDLAIIEEAFEEAELTLPTYDAEKYTLWIDTSLDTCSGIDYRFIINE